VSDQKEKQLFINKILEMKIGINFLFIRQFSYNTWHSQPRMLVAERHRDYANKATAQ
jgi:hypothetical protein